MGAPKNTPTEIIDKLNEAVNAGLIDPKINQRLADLGGEPMPMTPAEFGKLVADDYILASSGKQGEPISACNRVCGYIRRPDEMVN